MTHHEFTILLTDYVEGTLDSEGSRVASAHLESCPACQAMVDETRFAMAALHDAAEIAPSPWLLPRIMQATAGERAPRLREKLTAWLRPIFQPQVAYSLSMAVFSVSFLLFASGVNLRQVSLSDFNPADWVYRANSRGHMLMARAEKYYYDIGLVYEVQSILQNLRQQPGAQPAAPKNPKPAGSALKGESPRLPAEEAFDGAPFAGPRSVRKSVAMIPTPAMAAFGSIPEHPAGSGAGGARGEGQTL